MDELQLPLFPPDWAVPEVGTPLEGEARGVVVIDLNPDEREDHGETS